MHHHSLAVDVAHLQRRNLSPSCSRGVQRHHQDALKRGLGRVDQARNLRLGQDLGKMRTFFGYGVSAALQPRLSTWM